MGQKMMTFVKYSKRSRSSTRRTSSSSSRSQAASCSPRSASPPGHVEWRAIPDHQTSINALLAGEIDFVEAPPRDLYPVLQRDRSGGFPGLLEDPDNVGNALRVNQAPC